MSFFRKFATELWPLIDVRTLFPLNILRTNGQNLTKFCIHIDIDNILVGIVKRQISHIGNRVMPLIDVRILFLLNILRTNGQNLTKFCMHFYINNI